MKFSFNTTPKSTHSLLGGDVNRRSPRNPRSYIHASAQAVTKAGTVAFAVGSVVLVWVFFLSNDGQESNTVPDLSNFKESLNHNRIAVAVDVNSGRRSIVNGRTVGGGERGVGGPQTDKEEEVWSGDDNNAGGDERGFRSVIEGSPPQTAGNENKASSGDDNNDVEDTSTWPLGAAWLMSFPNSGTSYTLHTVRELTNTTTSTYYGLEGDIKDEPSVPVFGGEIGVTGPYLELIRGRTTNLPKWILTKTHCGGYSYSLNPDAYIVTPRKFLRNCLFGFKGVRSDKGNMTREIVQSSSDLVNKVVHIIRNPFDNVVARFHLDRYFKPKDWLKQYPSNELGFRKWCAALDDDKKALSKHRQMDSDLNDALSEIPCRAEWFRYVQWHNMAFTVTADLDLPELIFHYESYTTNFAETIDRLLAFLELDAIGVPEPFTPGKTYGEYYSAEEKRAIEAFVKEYSNKKSWTYFEHYFL